MSGSRFLDAAGRVAIAGDWHGDSAFAVRAIHAAAEGGAEGILHLGDFGIWPGRSGVSYLFNVNRVLDKLNMWLAFIDGNHEDHVKLASLDIQECGTRRVREHIVHLPRGFRWTWHGRSWVALGGATSLDRDRRVEGISWWREESITPEDLSKVITDGPADYMITHDAPVGVNIPGLESYLWSQEALDRAKAHRIVVRAAVEAVQPRMLWHGHMHVAYTTHLWAGDKICLVQGLADNGRSIDENIVVIDPAAV